MEDAIQALKRSMKSALQEAEVHIDAGQAEANMIAQRVNAAKGQLIEEELTLQQERARLADLQAQLDAELDALKHLESQASKSSFFGCCISAPKKAPDPQPTLARDTEIDEILDEEVGLGRGRANATMLEE
mmetsp:Transcript_25902/g.56263  ORF Transcript_25902/g.56263 Transcript_25902/m.56263 type:complete len:131 (+) Transcript_25902:241-633(+)